MVEAHLNGVRNATAAGWRVLEKGGSALDAVEEAVVVMEDDEAFDAGRGSFLNRERKVQLDSLIMDGATQSLIFNSTLEKQVAATSEGTPQAIYIPPDESEEETATVDGENEVNFWTNKVTA